MRDTEAESKSKKLKELYALSAGQKSGVAVLIIESEAGWGAKVDERLYFPSKECAEEFVDIYNKTHNTQTSTPEWYMFAKLV